MSNLFLSSSQLTNNSQHQRHHRFCLRMLLKNPDNITLSVLCGHNAMVSGSFKHALGTTFTQFYRFHPLGLCVNQYLFVFSVQYVQALKCHPENPMHSLYVGLTFFHMACQKFVARRHALLLQVQCHYWCVVSPPAFCARLQVLCCVSRVSLSCGGTWSCEESVRRASTTWAGLCTKWASHI